MNQSEFLAIACGLLKAQENACLQVVIDVSFASHWVKN